MYWGANNFGHLLLHSDVNYFDIFYKNMVCAMPKISLNTCESMDKLMISKNDPD